MSRIRKRWVGIVCAVLACFTAAPCASASMNGVDYSSWQSATAPCGVAADFGIVKVNQGTYRNPYWRTQAKCITDRGEGLGLYDYASGMAAVAEADVFVDLIGDYVGKAVLVLDWESNQNSAWGDSEWIRDWVNRVHARTNVWPMVYVSRAYVSQIPGDVRRNCALWVAQYANDNATGYQSSPWNAGASGEAMIQYSSHGWLDGYHGFLDLNLFMGERWQWDAYANPANAARADTPAKPGNGTPSAPAKRTEPTQCDRSCVVVRPGDTVSKYWPDWWNVETPSGNPSLIYPGQTICHKGSAASGPARTYTVRAGDTLSGIAARYGTTVAGISGYRSGNPNIIYPGEVVQIR